MRWRRRTKKKKAATQLITEYRKKFGIGQLWQFYDLSRNLIYESISVEDIRQNLINGTIPAVAMCRKNRVGETAAIRESIAKEEDRIEILFRPLVYHMKIGATISAIITAVISIIAGFINLGSYLGMGGFQTFAFAVVFLIMFFSMGVSTRNAGGCILTIIFGGALVLISGGKINFGFLAGFFIGFPIGVLLASLIGAIPGAILGALVGVIRLPSLPRLPQP
jgi:hypothetical protein